MRRDSPPAANRILPSIGCGTASRTPSTSIVGITIIFRSGCFRNASTARPITAWPRSDSNNLLRGPLKRVDRPAAGRINAKDAINFGPETWPACLPRDHPEGASKRTSHAKYSDAPGSIFLAGNGLLFNFSAETANSGEISNTASGSPFLVGTSTPASRNHLAARRI